MTTTLIVLNQLDSELLRALSKRSGKVEGELVREASDLLAARYDSHRRQVALRQARGIWSDRTNWPDLRSLRDEFDRF